MSQHDDHCWLTRAGYRWRIRRVRDHFIFLQRSADASGHSNYDALDAHRIDWEAYCNRASELLA
jgi:hypothetical protein